MPRLRYLSPLTAPTKGVHDALVIPFSTHSTSKGSAYRACVTFYLSVHLQRECISRLRYLLPLRAPPKGAHTALAVPFTTPSTSKGSAYRACGTFYYSEHLQRECIPRLRYLSPLRAPPKGVHTALVLLFTSRCAPFPIPNGDKSIGRILCQASYCSFSIIGTLPYLSADDSLKSSE